MSFNIFAVMSVRDAGSSYEIITPWSDLTISEQQELVSRFNIGTKSLGEVLPVNQLWDVLLKEGVPKSANIVFGNDTDNVIRELISEVASILMDNQQFRFDPIFPGTSGTLFILSTEEEVAIVRSNFDGSLTAIFAITPSRIMQIDKSDPTNMEEVFSLEVRYNAE